MPWVRRNIYGAMQTEKKDFVNVYFREADVVKGRQTKDTKAALAKRKASTKKPAEASNTTSSGTTKAVGKKTTDPKKKSTVEGKLPSGAST